MINWLKYFPITLRDDVASNDCRGPNFADAKTIELKANGCKLSLKAPRHRSTYTSPIYVKNIDGINDIFRKYNFLANDVWESTAILSRSWSYRKAWFAGTEGELYLSVSLARRKKEAKFKNVSFFHPKGFEFAIANWLDNRFGYLESDVCPYRAPVNWISRTQLPVFSASFEITGEYKSQYFTFPISDECFVVIDLGFSGSNEVTLIDMKNVAAQIIDSVRLELSPAVAARLAEMKKEYGDLSLSETFAPLKWPVAAEDIEKGIHYKPYQEPAFIFDEPAPKEITE